MVLINNIFSRLKLLGLLNTVAIGVLGLIVLTSIIRPVIGWDSWYYHLPFSSYLLNIGGGESSFIVSEHVYERYLGFPKASELIQGVIWYLTGSLNYITLINSLSFVFLIYIAARKFKIKVSDITFGLLSMPILSIHVISSYNDLFAGVLISIQVIASALIYDKLVNKTGNYNLKNYGVEIIMFSVATILAGNTKYMSWMAVTLVTLFLLIMINLKKVPDKSINLVLSAILVFILFVSSVSVLKNLYVYKNPFYPVEVAIPQLNIEFAGPEPILFNNVVDKNPGYAEEFGILAKPIYFLFSVTEIDWELRSLKKKYNIDSNVGDKPLKYNTSRTGGLWGIFIVGNLLLFIILLYFAIRRYGELKPIDKYLLFIFIFLSLLTCFMPRSHQLRYYFYWPILLIFFNIYFYYKFVTQKYLRRALSILYLISFFVNYSILHVKGQFIYPFPIRYKDYMTKTYPVSNYRDDNIEVVLDRDVLMILKENKNLCLDHTYNPVQFLYSRSIIGGDHSIEQVVHDTENCRVFPNAKSIIKSGQANITIKK